MNYSPDVIQNMELIIEHIKKCGSYASTGGIELDVLARLGVVKKCKITGLSWQLTELGKRTPLSEILNADI